jgi:hypothetical protein
MVALVNSLHSLVDRFNEGGYTQDDINRTLDSYDRRGIWRVNRTRDMVVFNSDIDLSVRLYFDTN